MLGRQINFYLTEEDLQEVQDYINKIGLIILSDPMKTSSLVKVDSLTQQNSRLVKYLSIPELEKEIVVKFIDTQNYYLIDGIDSPVIEFSPGRLEDGIIRRRGRIYYTKSTIVTNNSKNETFLKMADDFFKWFRKNFKNVKMKPYEDIHISERTLAWLNASPDRKLEEFPEVIKADIEKRKKLVA